MPSLLTRVALLALVVLHINAKTLRDPIDPQENTRNLRPIIGVLTQPIAANGTEHPDPMLGDATEYIAASYVKFLEGAGARVVAVRYNQTKSQLKRIYSHLNGMLLPGGGAALHPGQPYYEAGVALWEYLEEDKTFPVFGTCLGFEQIACLASGSDAVLRQSGTFNASNASWPLNFTRHARRSKLFRPISFSDSLFSALQHKNITYNAHSEGVTPDVFRNTKGLVDEYVMLATGMDKNGKEFVAAFEHKSRNIFGVQFHPEKSVFEWYVPANIPHEIEAIQVTQRLADVFVDAARKNFNSFGLSPENEAKILIQNSRHLYMGNKYFQEMWVFGTNETQFPDNIPIVDPTPVKPEGFFAWSFNSAVN